MQVTPEWIDNLKDNEVFVFGSNLAGRHGKGAAKQAMKWGAVYGQSFGLQGRTFAIPTVNASISNKLSLKKIQEYVDKFTVVAARYKHLKFLVTEVGCGLAGWDHKDIAPMFLEAQKLQNVYLPKHFLRVLQHLDKD